MGMRKVEMSWICLLRCLLFADVKRPDGQAIPRDIEEALLNKKPRYGSFKHP